MGKSDESTDFSSACEAERLSGWDCIKRMDERD
jgi:hypothetical protein